MKPSKKSIKLAQRIWAYLNGRYEHYDKEVNYVAKMIERTNVSKDGK